MIRHASFCPAFVTTTALVAISADAQAQTPPQTTEIERLAVQTTTPVGAYAISTLIEADFQVAPGTQGNERALNAYNLGLRRAVLGYRDFAVGQDWSNFQYVAALPESADFLGVTEGTVFARQMLVRYEQPIGGNMRVSISIENPETVTNTPQNVALADHDDDPLPDLTGQLFWSRGGTSLSLTGVARHMRVNPGAGALRGDAFGYGLSFAGVLSIPGTRDDLRFMLSGGRGIGRYIGVNLAPDAIYDSAVGSLTPVPLIAGFAAYRHNWGNSFRSTLMGSFQSIDNPDFASPLSNRTIWSIAANIFVTPLPRLDVGVEFRHTEREIESRASGALDRLQFTIKQGF